jgi:predicted phosphodiesterase
MTARVAALYDIHGNLPALEAALADADALAPDLYLIGGDIVSGPMPAETLELLLGLGQRALFIRGNADRTLVELQERPNDLWTNDRVSPARRAFLASLPELRAVTIEGLGETLFCHGSPRSDEEIVTTATPETALLEMLDDVREAVVVGGHTHMQFDRRVDRWRVVNAGSVGMPYGATGAHWALLGPGVELRRTPYDVDEAANRILATGWPQAERFVEENLRAVPDAAEAVAYFEGLAGRVS